jgi:hypothetical protein
MPDSKNKSKIKKSIDEYFDKQIYISTPHNNFIGNANNLKDLLNGRPITKDDLFNTPQKDLLVSMYVHLVQLNGKVKWHDWFIKGLIGVVIFGVIAGGITYICF